MSECARACVCVRACVRACVRDVSVVRIKLEPNPLGILELQVSTTSANTLAGAHVFQPLLLLSSWHSQHIQCCIKHCDHITIKHLEFTTHTHTHTHTLTCSMPPTLVQTVCILLNTWSVLT